MQASSSDAPDVADASSTRNVHAQLAAIHNNNPILNILGSGTITNSDQITNYVNLRPRTPPTTHTSNVNVSATLPPKPIVFHGRDDLVNDAVGLLLVPGTARLAILGSGGMGKTTVALALLYDIRMVDHFSNKHQRLFLSCEALLDADDMVVSLAKILGLPASTDLLTSVVTHLTNTPRTLLVLDNLETVWLAGGSPVAAVDNLLGRLAQIPSLSLIITCRGTDWPQSVKWSTLEGATLEPFPLDAALQTFQDIAGSQLVDPELGTSKQLLNAVDRLPLAVSLLGQLARRGNTPAELLARWNREHSSLLRTSPSGRINNIGVSVEVSMSMLRGADDTQEALPLLSICCMLPDGLRPPVFDALRPYFKNIDQARDTLYAYALANLGVGRVMKVLSPIRHFVLDRHPTEPEHRVILHSVYFGIASKLPLDVNEHYQKLAEAAAPEMGNLSSLLLALVDQPSQEVVESIVRLTMFTHHQQPTITLASSLLSRLEQHPRWRADCLRAIGHAQCQLDDYKSAVGSLTVATQLYLDLSERPLANWCKRIAADAHRTLGQYDLAEKLLNEARAAETELGHAPGLAACNKSLGALLLMRKDHHAAIQHVSAARQAFASLGQRFNAARCSEDLGNIYISQGDLDLAAKEIEHARSVFSDFNDEYMVAQTQRSLAGVLRRQRNFALAEQLLSEANEYFKANGGAYDIACCGYELGQLRSMQGRGQEALVHFVIALQLFEALGAPQAAGQCRQEMSLLVSPIYHVATAIFFAPLQSNVLALESLTWLVPGTLPQGPSASLPLTPLRLSPLPLMHMIFPLHYFLLRLHYLLPALRYLVVPLEYLLDRMLTLWPEQSHTRITWLDKWSVIGSCWRFLILAGLFRIFIHMNDATLPVLVLLHRAPLQLLLLELRGLLRMLRQAAPLNQLQRQYQQQQQLVPRQTVRMVEQQMLVIWLQMQMMRLHLVLLLVLNVWLHILMVLCLSEGLVEQLCRLDQWLASPVLLQLLPRFLLKPFPMLLDCPTTSLIAQHRFNSSVLAQLMYMLPVAAVSIVAVWSWSRSYLLLLPFLVAVFLVSIE